MGRVIGKGLTDELGDRIGLVIDGVDGRVHHVEVTDAGAAEVQQVMEARREALIRQGHTRRTATRAG